MRTLYVVAPRTEITQEVIDAATAAGASEVVCGVPRALGIKNPTYPFVHVERDDPEAQPLRSAAIVLRNYLNTDAPTNAQTVNAVKSLIVVVRRLARNEMGRT